MSFPYMFVDNQIRKPILLIVLVAGIFLAAIMPTTMSLKVYAQGQITINGAGATFPFPLIDTWRVDYKSIKPNVNINYQSIGSGGGVKQFIEKTVDFGATDAPLTASEVQRAPGAVHIPETIGSVVVAYNIPSMPNKGLKLTGPVLADIFLGKITKWNDPKIQSLNPGVSLPGEDIIVVHRSDGSGTTYVWTDYLSNISTAWNEQIGRGKSVQWPTGIGGPGNEGVANAIRGSPNTIGYVELAYALTTQMPYAYLGNQAGKFIEPTLESTRAAVAATAPTLPKGDASWEHISVVNAPGGDSYPVASFSYLILFKELSTNPSIDQAKAKALVDFMSWAITDGQQSADDLSYVPLPAEVVKLNQETLKSLTFQGKPLITSVGAQP
ncbi:MAG: phosphate ABC transporter substrate-binding protein PstS [Thermoproteota archaeon]|nr:phosphate ABC transporter substrate-binding protein PstS [Thermoproteota archaeon]